jgi:hypothetical protein
VVLGEVAASHAAATDLQAWKRDGAAARYGSIVGNCACVAARLGPDLRVLDAEINPRVSKKARGSEIGCWPWRSNNGYMSVSDADASSEIQRGWPQIKVVLPLWKVSDFLLAVRAASGHPGLPT